MQFADETALARKLEFVTLVAGGQNFCIEITQIREIRRWSPVTAIPHAQPDVLGVINLRGAVIPIVDLAARLGFEKIAASERHIIVITAIEDRTVGLLVESVSEILGVPPEDVRDAPVGLDDTATRVIKGIIPIEGGMTKVIDLEALLADPRGAAA